MHELSIATALFEQVRRHTPAGAVVRSIRLRIGPMQGIEPDSLRFGWQAIWQEAKLDTPEILLEMLQWQLACPDCGRKWESSELYVACACGCATPSVDGGADLQLVSMEVDGTAP